MEYPHSSGSFLNEARLLSGGGQETGCGNTSGAGLSCSSFGLSSGAGLSASRACCCSVHSLGLMERLVSRGSVLLTGGRRYTAATVLAACIGAAAAPTVWGGDTINVSSGLSSGVTLGSSLTHTSMNVYGSGQAEYTDISAGGWQNISDGGKTSFTSIYSGGMQNISHGGEATSTTIFSRGEQNVSDGGNVSFTSVISGGMQIVHHGGSAMSTNISIHGAQIVSGTVTSTSIGQDGMQSVSAGGIASGTEIGYWGSQYVAHGGVAYGTVVSSGGKHSVTNGGSSFDIIQSKGGNLTVFFSGADKQISMTGINADTGTSFQVQNGSASGFILYSGSVLGIHSGGVASNTTIEYEGEQYLTPDGISYDTTVSSGGRFNFFSGGGSAYNVMQKEGGHIIADVGTSGSQISTFISGINVDTGSSFLMQNGSASGFFIYKGGQQNVSSGGITDATNVSSGGWQEVFEGGVAKATTVHSSGRQIVYDKGVAENAHIKSGGWQSISAGGLANAATISAGGSQLVYNNGTADATNISSGGWQDIASGGLANATTIYSGGWQDINDSGVASATNISYGGWQNVSNGGVASATTIYSGGWQEVCDNGLASATKITAGGRLFIHSSGSAVNIDGPASGVVAGYGTVFGNMAIASGGMLTPANAYLGGGGDDFGALTVSSDLTIAPGGIYRVRVDSASPAADRVTASGSITVDGATFQHVAPANANGDNFSNSNWLVASAGNGVVGKFAHTETTLAFYNAILDYSTANEIWLGFQRSHNFSDLAVTRNQKAVALALDSLEKSNPGNTLVQTVLGVNASAIPVLYNQITGEQHASLMAALTQVNLGFSQKILNSSARKWLAQTIAASALGDAEALASISPRSLEQRFRNNFWADAGYARQSLDGDDNVGRSILKGPEISLGYDQIAPSGWLGGVAFRYGDHSLDVDSRYSEADIDSYAIGLHGGFQTGFGPGAARLVLGGVYDRHGIDAKRYVDLGENRQGLESDYHANSYQLFMEGAYAVPLGRIWLEPFANVSWQSLRASGFVEKGGYAALYAPSYSQNNTSHLLGLRLVLPVLSRLNVEAQAGWRHTYGKLDPAYSLGFVEGGDRFGIQGNRINRDEAVLDLRAEFAVRDNLRVGLEGNASLGDRGTSVRGGAFVALEW